MGINQFSIGIFVCHFLVSELDPITPVEGSYVILYGGKMRVGDILLRQGFGLAWLGLPWGYSSIRVDVEFG